MIPHNIKKSQISQNMTLPSSTMTWNIPTEWKHFIACHIEDDNLNINTIRIIYLFDENCIIVLISIISFA